MHNIPVTVLDNFFDNPDAVRELALQQEFKPSEYGLWPGKRTKQLHEISHSLHDTVCNRLFSLFYNFKTEGIRWKVEGSFQKVDKSYNTGWVHADTDQSILSGIIYLTPNADIKSGTSIYRQKPSDPFARIKHVDAKAANYKNEISNTDIEKYRLENNAQFEETIKVGNVYNRLLAFDSHMLHAAQDFFGDESEDNERLTLVLFATSLIAGVSPIHRSKRCM